MLLLCGLGGAVLTGCGDDPMGPAPPRDLSISPDTLRLSIGETGQFTVAITDTLGEPFDSAEVMWLSTDPTVATVDASGRVAAVGLGTASVLAVSSGFADSAAVVTGLVFDEISAGDLHTCGVVPGGAVYCWGDGRGGQLGNGRTEPSTIPVRVDGEVAFTGVSAGAGHTCALADDGTPWCWGRGTVGQRGDGTTDLVGVPTPVATDLTFSSVRAGWNHTCGVTTADRVYCWGSNFSGQLGTGSVLRLTPDSALTADRFADVRPGRDHTCAVSVDGQPYCWGRNDEGQLGLGTTSAPVSTPTPIPSAFTFESVVAAGGTYSCGLLPTRRLLCWGRGDNGQLGLGRAMERSLVIVDLTIPFTTVAPAATHACGTTTQRETYCWGVSRLGIPGATQSDVPLRIPVTLASITTGTFHTCGLTGSPGHALCWGGNNMGQLGTGTTTPGDVPELVVGQIRF